MNMKKRNLHFRLLTVLALFAFMGSAIGQTLMHSYTFEEGTYDANTVYDQAGSVDGAIGGSMLTIADGKATVSGATVNSDGWISFDGAAIALNTYSAVTLEAYVETGEVLNTGYTMMAYFGTSTPGNGCFWIQPTRAGDETRMEANNTSTSIVAFKSGYEVDDGKMHHIVGVLDADNLTYWLDGSILAQISTEGADFISTIGTDVANLFRGVDGWNDPNYNASIEEFNIYDGALDAATIVQHASDYLGILPTDARLDTLYANKGVFDPAFDTDIDVYEVITPYGLSEVTFTAMPVVDGASVTYFDGLGNEYPDGVVAFDKDEGVDVEVIVTALDGTTEMSYFVSIFPDDPETSAVLEDIQLSAGMLTMDFDQDSTQYTAIVPAGSTSIDVTGIPAAAGATVTGGGAIDVSSGMASTTISVTSEDGNATMEYMVDLYVSKAGVGLDLFFQHEVSGYVLSGVLNADPTLQVALKGETNQIWQLMESGVEGQYYLQNQDGLYVTNRPVTDGNWHFMMRDNLPNDLDSARFEVREFEPGRFYVVSVKRMMDTGGDIEDDAKVMMGPNDANLGTTVYSDKWQSSSWHTDGLTVWNILPKDEVLPPYDNYLEEITVSAGSLAPVFDPIVQAYSVTLPPLTTELTLGATPRDGGSVVTGTGTFDVSDGKGSLTITCTATYEGVEYPREYVVSYVTNVDLTLMHSYTFADGTAKDVVGTADGTVMGGYINEGIYQTFTDGSHISFPAEEIAINTYPSITVEAYTMDIDTITNGTHTMLTYFGTKDNSTSWGNDYWFTSLGNGGNSVTAISIGDYGAPWGNNNAVSSASIMDDGLPHHLVATLTYDSIALFIDGLFAGSDMIERDNLISNLSDSLAYLCKAGYNDPTYLGQVLELNIYAGEMDAQTISNRAYDYPLEDGTEDATLSDLVVGDTTIMGFASTTMMYVDTVDSDVAPTVSADAKMAGLGATATVTQATGVPGTATVVVTAADGTTQYTYTIEFIKPTAVKDVTPDFMDVYPTISDDVFTVSTDGKAAVASVYDLNGKMVMQKSSKASNIIIDIEAAGMYILKVEADGQVGSFKVFKTN